MTEQAEVSTETQGEDADLIRRLAEENLQLRRQLRQRKKKIEFSKVILVAVSLLTLAVTVFTCRMIWTTMDTTALAYLIPAVYAELATGTGFYYTKAREENKIKLASALGTGDDPGAGVG